MKAGWEVRPLGEVAEVINGGTPKSKVAKYWGGPVQWLTPKDMGKLDNPRVSETPRTITEEGLSASSARLSPAHSVILSTRAPIGHLAINEVPMAFNQGCRAIVPSERLDYQYVFYFLLASKAELNERGTGTTFKELSSTNLKSLPIPLPPLEEQRRIVAVLDEAFEGLNRVRKNTETNLTNARELFESVEEIVLNDENTVDGKAVQLSDVADLRGGFAFKSKQYTEAGHFVLRTLNITTEGTITRNNAKYISEDEFDSHSKFALEAFDTLFVMVGATLGKTGFVEPNDLPALLNQNMWVIRAKTKEIDPYYLYYAFRKITRPAMEKATGSARGFLKRDDVRTLSFKLPLIESQRSLVRRIVEIKDAALVAKRLYETKLTDLEDLRQSLLQKAFAGELT